LVFWGGTCRKSLPNDKPFVAETLRVNPSFTVKWFQNHTAYVIPKQDEGFRKAGFAEE
jgi:hypothetical protein